MFKLGRYSCCHPNCRSSLMNTNILSSIFALFFAISVSAVATEQKTAKNVQLTAAAEGRGSRKVSPCARRQSLFPPAAAQNKVCTRQLEQIIFSPPNNVKDYLARIAAQMRVDIQVIMAAFAAGNLEYIRTYTVKYGILITVIAPFGLPVLVADSFVAYTDFIQNVALAQTYTGRDGFYVDSATQYYNYQFVLMSTDGQMVTFVLSLPLTSMPNSAIPCL